MNKKKIILIAVSIAVVAGAGFWLFGSSKAQHKVTYETAVVTRGEISESITATGTIEPVTEVEVGTQVSGIIDKIYADYNSVVTKGQLIAEMDCTRNNSSATPTTNSPSIIMRKQKATTKAVKHHLPRQNATFRTPPSPLPSTASSSIVRWRKDRR